MAKRSKILLCIVIVIACVSCCFLPIMASALVPVDTLEAPVCPVLYGGYDSSDTTNVRSVGGYAQTNPALYNSINTWYMYCYRTTTDSTRDPQMFTDVRYQDYGFGFDSDSIYYGAETLRDGYVSLNFACMNTESFYFFCDFPRKSDGMPGNWGVRYVEFAIELRDSTDIVTTQNVRMYYSDYLALKFTSGPWITFDSFCEYFNVDIFGKYVSNFSVTPYTQGASVPFVCYFRIPSASKYITEKHYERNFYEMGQVGFENGYDTGYGVGYEDGFSDGFDFDETGVWGMISESVGGFLSFEIYNGFTIGQVLMICMSVPLFIWIIKLLAGG